MLITSHFRGEVQSSLLKRGVSTSSTIGGTYHIYCTSIIFFRQTILCLQIWASLKWQNYPASFVSQQHCSFEDPSFIYIGHGIDCSSEYPLSGPHSRFGDTPTSSSKAVCPQNGSEVLEGLSVPSFFFFNIKSSCLGERHGAPHPRSLRKLQTALTHLP